MTAARYALGQGFAPDARAASALALANLLLERLAQAGHEGRPFKLRDCVVARGEAHASGPCLSVQVLDHDRAPLETGFAYLFLPNGWAAHEEMALALMRADPLLVQRQTSTFSTFSSAERSAA